MKPRDADERRLNRATRLLPRRRKEWGAAMRAELAAIDAPDERTAFSRSAARAAFTHGWGLPLAFASLAAIVTAVSVLVSSRSQIAEGGPGVLPVTALAPMPLLFLGAAIAAALTRRLRTGLVAGLIAGVACLVTVAVVVAIEGLEWMDRHGFFVLDGDSPKQPVDDVDVILDFFTTGMWIVDVVYWTLAILLGAAAGTLTVRIWDRLRGDRAAVTALR